MRKCQQQIRRVPNSSRLRVSQRPAPRHRARRLRRSILLLLLGLPLLGFSGRWSYRQFQQSPLFRVEAIEVERCMQISPREVWNALQLGPNENILLLDLPELAGRACSNPWIQEASIRRDLPHTLLVRIVERRPAGILLGENPYLVSEDGMILASLKARREEYANLPYIRLAGRGQFQVGDRIESGLFQRSQFLWREFSRTLKGMGVPIREIWEAKDGDLTLHLGRRMPAIRLHPDSLEEQFPRLKTVCSLSGGNWGSLDYIDLRFSRKVILKLKEGGGERFGKG